MKDKSAAGDGLQSEENKQTHTSKKPLCSFTKEAHPGRMQNHADWAPTPAEKQIIGT